MAATIKKDNTVIHISALYAFKQVVRLFKESCKQKYITFEVWGNPSSFGKAFLISKSLSKDCVHTCKSQYACTIFEKGTCLLDIPHRPVSNTKNLLYEFILPTLQLSKFLCNIRICAALHIYSDNKSMISIDQLDDQLAVQRSDQFEDIDPRFLSESQKIGRSIAWPRMEFSKIFSSEAQWFLKNIHKIGLPKNSKKKLTYFLY